MDNPAKYIFLRGIVSSIQALQPKN